jgi:DNA-binding response OmpR family regulator
MSAGKLLIVEDELDFLETIINRLKRRKFEVWGVSTGAEAIELAKRQDFDLTVLDVKLPEGMDGIEVLRALRKIQPATPVIMLTGHASIETSEEGMKLGAYDYILKPVRFEELLVKISAAMNLKPHGDTPS